MNPAWAPVKLLCKRKLNISSIFIGMNNAMISLQNRGRVAMFPVTVKIIHSIRRSLLHDNTDSEVAKKLNEKRMLSGTGKPFDARRISRIRRDYKIPSYHHHLRKWGFVSMSEICKQYQVERWIVTKWRKTGQIQASLYDNAGRFLYYPEVRNYTMAIGGVV